MVVYRKYQDYVLEYTLEHSVENGLKRYYDENHGEAGLWQVEEILLNTYVVPIISDPMNPDGDGDTVPDTRDKQPLKKNIVYNRKAVIDYANEYSGDITNPKSKCYDESYSPEEANENIGYVLSSEHYNKEYPSYEDGGGDCANYASQCMHAGGIPMNSDWYIYGNQSFYVNKIITKAKDFLPFLTNKEYIYRNDLDCWRSSLTWGKAENQYTYLTQKKPEYVLIYKLNDGLSANDVARFAIENGIQAGDIMYMCSANQEINDLQYFEIKPSHTTVVYSVTDDSITFTGHTSNRLDRIIDPNSLINNDTTAHSHLVFVKMEDVIYEEEND